ncbi:hypothetical protein Ndes2526B_g08349 [Nannochloris sp. 'desiccata']
MSDNPFADNPFAVSTSGGNGTVPSATSGAWGGGTAGAWGSSSAPAPPAPAPAPTSSFTLPSFSKQTSTVPTGGDPRRDADLNRREAELNRREAELRRLELELRSAPGGASKKNWPKYCSCVHHDIAGEVPAAMQGTVRSGYYAYLGLIICLFWNFIGCAGYLIAEAIKDSAFGYGSFFLFFTTAHLVFSGWSAVGPPILNSTSHTGWWVTVQNVYGENKGLGVVYYIGAALWSLEAVWSFWTLKRVYTAFRGKGMTAADVKRDAARGAATVIV